MKKNKLNDILDKNFIENEINTGLSIKDLAKKLNISSTGLFGFIKRHNINYIKKIKYECNNSFFDINNQQSFYWAGFIAADGSINNKGDFALSLKLADYEHIEKFKSIIESNATIYTISSKEVIINGVETKSSGCATIRFRNKLWLESLKRFNIIPNKTKVYDIPTDILNHELFHHFLRGYFDGDGWFAKSKDKYNTCKIALGICGNLSVIDKIKNKILEKCNIEGTPYLCKQNNIYKLTFAKQHDVAKIIDYIYQDASIYLERKYQTSILAKELDSKTIFLHLDKDKLAESYKRLKSYEKVAEELNCCTSSVFNYIKKYGIIKE